MSRLAVKDTHVKRPFKPQIYRSRCQHRSYSQESYQNRLDSRNRGQFMDNRPRQNYRGKNFRGNTIGYDRQNKRRNYGNERDNDYNRDRNKSRERTVTRNYSSKRDRSSSNSRLRSGSKANTNRDRIWCYKYREYDHFARDCPISREERDLEKFQQMLNIEE